MLGGPPNMPAGPDGIHHLFATIGRAEQRWTVEEIVAEGDTVVVRATNVCRQDSFLGIPGGGRTQVFTAMFMHRFVGGRIHRTWRNADDLGRLHQLGAQIKPGRSPQGGGHMMGRWLPRVLRSLAYLFPADRGAPVPPPLRGYPAARRG